jgi:hypothetical protein
MKAMGIVYWHYWVNRDAKSNFIHHLAIPKDHFAMPKIILFTLEK